MQPLRRHAERLSIPKSDLIKRHGWNVSYMAVEAQQTYAGACPYCHATFEGMGHGLQDITLDIVDPAQPPYYRTNARWVCQTCNRKKGRLSPAEFEADREVFEFWEVGRRAPSDDRGDAVLVPRCARVGGHWTRDRIRRNSARLLPEFCQPLNHGHHVSMGTSSRSCLGCPGHTRWSRLHPGMEQPP